MSSTSDETLSSLQGALRHVSDICIIAPEEETYKIRELHLPIDYLLGPEVEAHFFKE